MAMAVILGRLAEPGLDLQNFWYYSGSVVTGGSSEAAVELLNNINNFTIEIQSQTRQFAQAELLTYMPYIILLCALFLGGGLLCTIFIWRSVAVPGELVERVNAYKESASVPQAQVVQLDDDGELVHISPSPNAHPAQHYQEQTS
jgi:hypothetical protein